jgi:hypothetical protein
MYRLMPFSRRTLAAAFSATALALAAGPLAAQAPARSGAHAVAAPGACVAGHSQLKVGDARLASFTPLAADTVDMVMERAGATRNALSTEHVSRSRQGGRDAWLIVQWSQTPMGASLDSVWVDARTWAPLRHFSTFPRGRVDVTYAGGRVTGTLVRGDTASAVDQALDAGVFDLSASADALAAVTLCPGSVVHVNSYDPAIGMRNSEYHLVGSESVEIGGRQYAAFAVETTMGPRTVRLYIDPATHHVFAWRAEGQGITMRGTSRFLPGR